MSAPGREKVAADVVGFFPHESRLMLDVGTKQGIKRGMPVATYAGLIGRVETVDSATCQVLLLTSPGGDSRISALVQRRPPNAPVAGLIHGETAGSLRLEMADPTAPVDVGDRVVTTGFSDQIPRGIPIGRVVSVEDDPAFGKRTALVLPYVNVGELREVVVIR
jgi:rod shape-determining protein MreC